jgi:hypothetical protein
MVCMNNSGGTACYLLPRILSSDDDLIAPIDDLEVAPEPTEPPVIVDNGATDVVELLDEPTATPEPTIDDGGPVVDQPVVDGGDSAPEPTATPGDDVSQGPVVDDSLVSDGGDVAPEPTRDPIVIEPQIDVEIIAPIEEITLT